MSVPAAMTAASAHHSSIRASDSPTYVRPNVEVDPSMTHRHARVSLPYRIHASGGVCMTCPGHICALAM